VFTNGSGRLRVGVAAIGVVCAVLAMTGVAMASSNGSLYQRLVVSWSGNNWQGNDRATFQIPGIGYGDVVCNPTTTWIQMVPSDRVDENDMWSVKWETKNGAPQTAVKDARVYTFSTPTSTIPHGTGPTSYEGFNQNKPIEASNTGSMIGLISKRGPLNSDGGAGVAPTSVRLQWSWTGFGSSAAQCRVVATFVTEVRGPSRVISEGRRSALPDQIGAVSSFNINWHGQSEYPIALKRVSSLTIPQIGVLNGTCQAGADGDAYLTLRPPNDGNPYAQAALFQGEGIQNETINDYYTDPVSGLLGPIALPGNGFVSLEVLPAWDASTVDESQLFVSSIRKLNDLDPAADYCEISVQAITAPNPALSFQ
jgi:hypothetical protein